MSTLSTNFRGILEHKFLDYRFYRAHRSPAKPLEASASTGSSRSPAHESSHHVFLCFVTFYTYRAPVRIDSMEPVASIVRCSVCGGSACRKWRTNVRGELMCKPCWRARDREALKKAPVEKQIHKDLRHPHLWELTRGKEAIFRRLQEEGYTATNRKVMTLMVSVPTSATKRASKDGFVPTDERDYAALVAHIDWSKVSTVLDPWCGSGTTKRMLEAHTRVCLTDIVKRGELDALANAVERPDMDAVVRAFGPFDMVVTSPFFELNDLAVGAALRIARKAVAIHVNTRHLGQPAAGRMDLMARFASEKRLVVISGLPKSSRVTFNHEWIIVFHSEAFKNELCLPGENAYTTVLWRAPSESCLHASDVDEDK